MTAGSSRDVRTGFAGVGSSRHPAWGSAVGNLADQLLRRPDYAIVRAAVSTGHA
ncbi:hypothetical protein ACFQU2_16530 [Siccirubricoccus deserti]|uniref:Uncharacterized protein n=1 Tax=Siccirubricoccus deserti TaxID=2013562 RepID=A0A9X0R581_9PROT|nr:hypothetical protein [Siccirubricoccus deserti]MBC4019170.1 hypothetical protein [Siccirubricoccus deserti]